MNSYGVRCIFKCPKDSSNTLDYLYEERITVWKAEDADEAIDKAVAEAEAYADENGFTYTGLAQSFWMFTTINVSGIEVFSLLRESNLELEPYLDTFFSNGDERQKTDRDEPIQGEQSADGTPN
jgi:hypothetical protein